MRCIVDEAITRRDNFAFKYRHKLATPSLMLDLLDNNVFSVIGKIEYNND